MVQYRHGTLRIIDRAALEAHACECYLVIRDEFDRISGV